MFYEEAKHHALCTRQRMCREKRRIARDVDRCVYIHTYVYIHIHIAVSSSNSTTGSNKQRQRQRRRLRCLLNEHRRAAVVWCARVCTNASNTLTHLSISNGQWLYNRPGGARTMGSGVCPCARVQVKSSLAILPHMGIYGYVEQARAIVGHRRQQRPP